MAIGTLLPQVRGFRRGWQAIGPKGQMPYEIFVGQPVHDGTSVHLPCSMGWGWTNEQMYGCSMRIS